jgi:hypothetical protein
MRAQWTTAMVMAAAMAAVAGTACRQAAEDEPAAMATGEAGTMSGDTMGGDSMGGDTMAAAGPATYRIELTSLWSKESFPLEYPDGSLLHRPHFSGLIGASHDAGYRLFAAGQTPSPGLERLSETGKHDPLDAEIRAAIAAGRALALAESEPLRDLAQAATAEIAVDGDHSLVSVAAMIAPSPDWFAGVAGVELLENGAWVATKTVDLEAWDSGGDGGTTYLADDMEADPKQPTTRNTSPHFVKDGVPMPVARLTFTRL